MGLPDFVKPRAAITASWANDVVSTLRSLSRKGNRTAVGRKGGGGACHFGEIITLEEGERAIRGGLIHCGDQNWNIDPQPINTEADGEWLIYLEVDCEVNRDDDGEILMPGVKTGTRPTGDWEKDTWTEETDYPENENPEAATGTGTVILPIGKLKIEDGTISFVATGCGHFTVTHCAGTLGYSRS